MLAALENHGERHGSAGTGAASGGAPACLGAARRQTYLAAEFHPAPTLP